jgi:hypothetical protein
MDSQWTPYGLPMDPCGLLRRRTVNATPYGLPIGPPMDRNLRADDIIVVLPSHTLMISLSAILTHCRAAILTQPGLTPAWG